MAVSSLVGVPVLVRPGGSTVLEQVQLDAKGKGVFDEAWLQRLVHESPECLPISELEPDLGRFTPICRELPVPGRGFIDNLLMTGSGHIALVETKLFRNPEARRQAVAQALDYATGIFSLGFEAFEKAVLGSTFAPLAKPASLYEALPDGDKLAEPDFIDAVSANLRRGRALVLVVGDGIRSEAEALLAGMHAHARFGFTLALIELGVFRMPEALDSFIVRPRTLAKTAIVQRTIVEVIGSGATVRELPNAVPGGIGTESYWDTLDSKIPGARVALEDLIRNVEPLGVYPELLASLNLKWPRPNGSKPVNMGYFKKSGGVWVDAACWFSDSEKALGYLDLAKAYVDDLAQVFGCDVRVFSGGLSWTLWKNGSELKLSAIMHRLGDWMGPLQRYIAAIENKDAASEPYTRTQLA